MPTLIRVVYTVSTGWQLRVGVGKMVDDNRAGRRGFCVHHPSHDSFYVVENVAGTLVEGVSARHLCRVASYTVAFPVPKALVGGLVRNAVGQGLVVSLFAFVFSLEAGVRL